MILSCFTKVIHVASSNYLFSLTCFEKYGSSFGNKAIIMIHAEGIEFSNLFACKFNMKWLDSSLNKTFKKNWFGLIRSSFFNYVNLPESFKMLFLSSPLQECQNISKHSGSKDLTEADIILTRIGAWTISPTVWFNY